MKIFTDEYQVCSHLIQTKDNTKLILINIFKASLKQYLGTDSSNFRERLTGMFRIGNNFKLA